MWALRFGTGRERRDQCEVARAGVDARHDAGSDRAVGNALGADFDRQLVAEVRELPEHALGQVEPHLEGARGDEREHRITGLDPLADLDVTLDDDAVERRAQRRVDEAHVEQRELGVEGFEPHGGGVELGLGNDLRGPRAAHLAL